MSPQPSPGPTPGSVFELSQSGKGEAPAVYRSSTDIIAVQWLPKLMTFLCVHQPQGGVQSRVERLFGIMARIGAIFVTISAFSTWFFVGWLVDRYESTLAVSEARISLVQNSEAIIVVDDEDRIRHTNPAASELLGLTEEPTENQPINAYWKPDDAGTLDRLLQESRDNQPPRGRSSLKFRHRQAGSCRWRFGRAQ